MHRIYYWPKFWVFFPTGFYMSRISKQRLVVVNFCLFLQNNQTTLDWKPKMAGLKNCKSCQENILLSLAKGKLDAKNEWKFSNQSGEVMSASIYLTNRRFPYLEYDCMIANIFRLNLVVLKISETFQENTNGRILCQ